jgi:hypothetical protein
MLCRGNEPQRLSGKPLSPYLSSPKQSGGLSLVLNNNAREKPDSQRSRPLVVWPSASLNLIHRKKVPVAAIA